MKQKIKRYPLTYNPIIEYWNKIDSGEEVVSNKVRRVYKKLVDDLHNQDSEYEYSPTRANHAIEFVENFCKHSKGEMGGKPFIMELWQKSMTAALFGFIHKIDETRKYREFILIVERKNGKSAWSSAIGLYMLVADGEPLGRKLYQPLPKKTKPKLFGWNQSGWYGVDAVWLWVFDESNDKLLAKAKIPHNEKGEIMVGEEEVTIEFK